MIVGTLRVCTSDRASVVYRLIAQSDRSLKSRLALSCQKSQIGFEKSAGTAAYISRPSDVEISPFYVSSSIRVHARPGAVVALGRMEGQISNGGGLLEGFRMGIGEVWGSHFKFR